MSDFSDGMRLGQEAYYRNLRYNRDLEADARAKETHDAQMALTRLQTRAAQRQEDQAGQVQDMRNAAAQRYLAGEQNDPAAMRQTGISLPSQQMVEGGMTGYGAGPAAVRDMAGDYARESARMPGAAPIGAVGLPTTPYTQRDNYRDMRAIAQMQGRDQDVVALDQASRRMDAQQAVTRAISSLSDPAKRAEFISKVNTTVPNLMIVQPTRPGGAYGVSYMRADTSAGHVSLTEAQLKQVVAGEAMMDYDYEAGLRMLSGVDKDLAQSVVAANQAHAEAAKVNNDAFRAQSLDDYHQGILGIERQRLGAQQAQANRADVLPLGSSADGRRVIGLDRRSGKLVDLPLPEGFDASSLFPKATGAKDVSLRDMVAMATQMVGQPTGRRDDSNQPETYTFDKAFQRVTQMLNPTPAPTGVPPDVLKRTAELLNKQTQPAALSDSPKGFAPPAKRDDGVARLIELMGKP